MIQARLTSETPIVRPGDVEAFPSSEFRDSRAFFAAYGFVAASVAIGFASAGWALAAALAVGVTGWAGYRMVATPVRVRVSESGVEDHSFWYSPGLIRWSEIVEVREGPWGAIEVDLRDEASFWEKLGPLKAIPRVKMQLFYRLGPAAIIPWSLAGSRAEVVGALQDGLDTHTLRSLTRPERLEGDSP
jgi:hypothetical protein